MSDGYEFRPVDGLTVDTSAYADGDVIGGRLRFDMTPVSGGATIRGVRLVDDDDEKAPMTLYLFGDVPTDIADNAAFAPDADDLDNLVAIIPIVADDYDTINGNAIALLDNLVKTIPVKKGALWGYLVSDGTPTYTAGGDLSLTFLHGTNEKTTLHMVD